MNILFSLLDHRAEVLFELSNTLFKEYNHVPYYSCDDSWVNEWSINKCKHSNNLLKFDSSNLSNDNYLIEDRVLVDLNIIRNKDRYLKKKTDLYSTNLLKSWYYNAKSFLIENEIHAILIEGTPAFELVLELAAKELMIKVIVPDNLWKFKNWSVIYKSSNYAELYPTSSDFENLFYDHYHSFQEKTYQRVLYEQRLSKFQLLLNSVSCRSSKVNGEPLIDRIKSKICTYLNRLLIKYNKIPQSDYYVYFMHIEPEKTVDNVGFSLESQYSLIWHIAKKIPLGRCLVVKEHPDNKGRLSLDIIKKIKAIPAVLYVSPKENTKELFSNSLGVFTISGTISIEAQNFNNNVYVFGNGHFLKSNSIKKIENITAVSDYFLVESKNHEPIVSNYISNLSKYAFNFEFSDCIGLPSCLKDENISRMAYSVNYVINTKFK